MSRVATSGRSTSQGLGRGVTIRALSQLPSASCADRIRVCMPVAGARSIRSSWSGRIRPRIRGGTATSSLIAARASRSARPLAAALSRSRSSRCASFAPRRHQAFAVERVAAAPAALGSSCAVRRAAASGASRCASLDEAGDRRPLDLAAAHPLPLGEDQAEIDRLRDQQGGRHHQRDLADQALRAGSASQLPDFGGEHVAAAPHRLDQLGIGGILLDLLPAGG